MNLELLNEIDSFVWGPPLLVLLVGTGVFLSLRLGWASCRLRGCPKR